MVSREEMLSAVASLEAAFTPINTSHCCDCKTRHWQRRQQYRRSSELERLMNRGCCAGCSNGFYAKYNDNTPSYDVPKYIQQFYVSETYGFFNPNIPGCNIPRHLRSKTCLSYVCEEVFGKDYDEFIRFMQDHVTPHVLVIMEYRKEHPDWFNEA